MMGFSRNVQYGPAVKLSTFRKIALGTWRTVGDPSVYGVLEIDAAPALDYVQKLRTRSQARVTLSHLMGKIAAETLKRHPEINATLRAGGISPRKTIDIFFQVAMDTEGKELSGMVIREADKKTILQIVADMESQVDQIRNKGDPAFKKMKKTMSLMPAWLVRHLLSFTGWLMYDLNLWSPLLGTPRDPFGGIMITNIGSLGLDQAFAPIVPYSHVPILIAMGAVRDEPVVRDGKIAIGKVLRLCTTVDHRLVDGMYASKMAKTVQLLFANPEKYFD